MKLGSIRLVIFQNVKFSLGQYWSGCLKNCSPKIQTDILDYFRGVKFSIKHSDQLEVGQNLRETKGFHHFLEIEYLGSHKVNIWAMVRSN